MAEAQLPFMPQIFRGQVPLPQVYQTKKRKQFTFLNILTSIITLILNQVPSLGFPLFPIPLLHGLLFGTLFFEVRAPVVVEQAQEHPHNKFLLSSPVALFLQTLRVGASTDLKSHNVVIRRIVSRIVSSRRAPWVCSSWGRPTQARGTQCNQVEVPQVEGRKECTKDGAFQVGGLRGA